MAWTADRVRILKILYRSMWSLNAIAIVLGQTRRAVENKLTRLANSDAEIELIAFLRDLFRRSGGQFINAEQARSLLKEDGFARGLDRSAA